jgi:hypothetical protein
MALYKTFLSVDSGANSVTFSQIIDAIIAQIGPVSPPFFSARRHAVLTFDELREMLNARCFWPALLTPGSALSPLLRRV